MVPAVPKRGPNPCQSWAKSSQLTIQGLLAISTRLTAMGKEGSEQVGVVRLE